MSLPISRPMASPSLRDLKAAHIAFLLRVRHPETKRRADADLVENLKFAWKLAA